MAEPLFSFGVIADVQYANIDDAWDFMHKSERHYRNALEILKDGINTWNEKQVSFVLQLGDLIDGKNADEGISDSSLENVLTEFKELKENIKVHNVIGNHELYNYQREELYEKILNIPSDSVQAYYHFYHENFCFIILDSYEFSLICERTKKEALAYLKEKNPNDVEKATDWTKGLKGSDRRFLPYNGSISEKQLNWLQETLTKALTDEKKVVVCSHIPICPGSTPDDKTLLWNYEEVLNVLHKFKNVVAFFAGHDHSGGFVVDNKGIYHKTFEAPLETDIGDKAYGVVEVYNDKLRLNGYGKIKSRDFLFQN